MQSLYYIISAILVLTGLAGTVIPALPGLGLMLGGFILAAWADSFHKVGTTTLIILAALALSGMIIDFLAGLLGAQKSGASKEALTGALIGTVAGLFLGLAGVIVGPVIGAIVGEWIARRNPLQAGKVGLATVIGLAIGTAVKIGCAFAMVATFTLAVLF